MNTLFIACLLLLPLYISSSISKIQNIIGTAKYLQSKLNFLPLFLCIIGIIGVIILKFFGSSIILYSAYTNKYKKIAYYSVIGLILFNIFATLIFHFPPLGEEYINFMKNLSITGGFILLLDKFN